MDSMKAEKTEIWTLLKSGVTPEQIQERTGLSRGRISQIKKEMTSVSSGDVTEDDAILLEAKYILLEAMRHLADKLRNDTSIYSDNTTIAVDGLVQLYRCITEVDSCEIQQTAKKNQRR